MRNYEEIGRELQRRGKTDALKQLAQSDDGLRLGKMVDANAIEQAAKSGDGDAIRSMLTQVLSTEEGRRLAENVRKMMEN